MKIIADKNLADIEAMLAGLGEVTLVAGRDINESNARQFDALLIRSITPVTERLLDGSNIRFVGTATSGLDHIDLKYIKERDIRLAHAAGSNADAVVDYCLAVMAVQGFFSGNSAPVVGIVGFGQVGSRLYARLNAMGVATRICDPLIEAAIRNSGRNQGSADLMNKFSTLENLADCDVVSLHVPLTSEGQYVTRGLIGAEFLAAMKQGALLINTCRGGVVNEDALLQQLTKNNTPLCASDVWETEPAVNAQLVARLNIATPHIAGYSARAKLTASQMIVFQLQQFMERAINTAVTADSLSAINYETILSAPGGTWPENSDQLASVIAQAFQLPALSKRFKQAVAEAEPEPLPAEVFDGFRTELRSRLEFSEINAQELLGREPGPDEQAFLLAAGFVLR